MSARACRTNRHALAGLLDDPLGAALPKAARAHLDHCRACRTEFGQLVLAGHVLRRMLRPAAAAEPPPTAWPRLRARIQRQEPRPGRAASPVLGLFLGSSLAVALLLPLGALRVGQSASPPLPTIIHEAGLDPAAIRAAARRDAEGEARRLRATTLAGKEASSGDRTNRARVDLIRQELTLEPARRSVAPRSLAVSVQ